MSFPPLPLPGASLPWPATLTSLLRLLDSRVPLAIKRRLVEPLLNRTFAEPLEEGEFDALEGRRITLLVDDLGMTLTLGLVGGQIMLSDAPGETSIRGGWREFLCLATRHEDPDSLFFQRRLSITGDTELSLMIKNLLDGSEEWLAQGRLCDWLGRFERLVERQSS